MRTTWIAIWALGCDTPTTDREATDALAPPAAAPAPAQAPAPDPDPAASADDLPLDQRFRPPPTMVFRPVVSRAPNRPFRPSGCRAHPDDGVGIGHTLASCSEQLTAAEALIGKDPEVCGRLKGPWLCFTSRSQSDLERMRLKSYDELGLAEERVRELRFRAERWRTSTKLREIIVDVYGEPLVCDAVARDVLYEGWLLVTLARIPAAERTPEQERWWAEAAYHLLVMLSDPALPLLEQYQPKMIAEARDMLTIATAEPVPPIVAEAIAAGRSGKPWTAPAPVSAPAPAPR